MAATKRLSRHWRHSRHSPLDRDGQREEERGRVGDVVKRVDHLGPDVDVDGGRVGDDFEALLEAVLEHRDGHKHGIEDAEHHDQLQKVGAFH